MARIVETKAIISGEERLSPMLDKLAKKFAEVQRVSRQGEHVEKFATALNRVRSQMQAIEKFNSAKLGFQNARASFREAEAAVMRTARAMREGKGDATALASAYQHAQRAVSTAARQFEMQKTAVLSGRRALREAGVDVRRLASEQERLASAVRHANSALDQQGRKGGGRLKPAVGNAVGTLGLVAGPGILHGTKEAVTAGAHIQSEVVKMRAAGIPEDDIQRELGQSASLAAKYTNVKRSDILERYKELRSVLQHPEEASHLLETTIKANSAMNAIDRSGRMAQGLQFAIKGAEVLGLAQDPKRFEAYLDAFIKAQQVMGETITPEQMFEFAKYSKASGSALSDRFKFTTGVSLSQEMGGSTTGVSVDQFVKQIVGGFQGAQHAAAKEFVALGLANKDDFEKTKTGEIKGFKPGKHVAGHRLAMTDPDLWVYQYLLPALEKKGAKSQEDQIAMVRRLFPSARAADVVSKLITQRPSLEAHARLYPKAEGLNAFDTNQGDPFVAFNSFKTSMENFAGTLTSPMMESAAGTLSSMAGSIARWSAALAEWQKGNPATAGAVGAGAVAAGAVGGGILTYNLISGLINGFGLKASAVALDGSAAALVRAAAALGGASAVGTGAAGGAGGAAAARSVAGAAIGTVAGAAGFYFGSTEAANAGEQDIYRRNPATGQMEMTPYGQSLRGGFDGAKVEAELKGEAKVTGEAKITIDIPGLGMRSATVPLTGVIAPNGPGSLGTSSPDAAAAPVGAR